MIATEVSYKAFETPVKPKLGDDRAGMLILHHKHKIVYGTEMLDLTEKALCKSRNVTEKQPRNVQ